MYYSDYPTEPIGGSNPYHKCSYCGLSVPYINGDLNKHLKTCNYRINKEKEMTDNILELVPKDKKDSKESIGYIKMTFSNDKDIILQADSFGAYDQLHGFIAVWSDQIEGLVGLYNASHIKSIEIVEGKDD